MFSDINVIRPDIAIIIIFTSEVSYYFDSCLEEILSYFILSYLHKLVTRGVRMGKKKAKQLAK